MRPRSKPVIENSCGPAAPKLKSCPVGTAPHRPHIGPRLGPHRPATRRGPRSRVRGWGVRVWLVGVLAGSAESTLVRKKPSPLQIGLSTRSTVQPVPGRFTCRGHSRVLTRTPTGTHGYSRVLRRVLTGAPMGSSGKGGGRGPMRGRRCKKCLATARVDSIIYI